MPTSPSRIPHSPFIVQRLPTWLKHTSAQDAEDFRRHLALTHVIPDAEPDWLANGLPDQRDAVRAARRRYRRASQTLAGTLKAFQGLLAFAEPLLQARLDAELGETLNLHTTDLVQFHEEADLWQLATRTTYQKQSLLQAALQNFGDDVTFLGKSAITLQGHFHLDLTDAGLAYRYTRHRLSPAVFARLCRELDLGARYQQHLQAVFETPATQDRVRRDSIDANRQLLRLEVTVAKARQRIGPTASRRLLALLDAPAAAGAEAPPVQASLLSMSGVPLHDILLFALASEQQADSLLLYLPGDPDDALTEHASMPALERYLKGRLNHPGFRRLFQRYVPLQQQQHLFDVLGHNLARQVVDKDGPWHSQEQDSLYLSLAPVAGELFGVLQDRHLQRLKDEARVLMVPTVEADEKARKARLEQWETRALNVLNAAAMFVPALGPVMLAVTAVQLIKEVYEGVEDWQDGDVEGAMAHLQSVAITAGMLAGSVLALKAAPALVDALIEVPLPDGSTRLYLPDLAPYRLDTSLPAEVTANDQGQYRHADRHYIRLGADLYEQQFDAHQQQWQLRHPEREDAYRPALEHNGQGAWRSVHEQPLSWSRATLLRRLGPLAQGLSDAELEQACQVSGTREDALRRLHAANLGLPPLLADTLQRLRIARQLRAENVTGNVGKALFEQRYLALVPPQPHITALCARLPGLSPVLARSLLDTVGPARLARWVPPAAIPTKLLEEAATLAARVPLVRATEGLYWPALATPQSTRLALLCLEHAPGWDASVVLEARSGGPRGPLLQRVGRATQAQRRVLVHGAEGYQACKDDLPLHAPGDDLFAALHDSIAPRYRQVLGLDTRAALQQRVLSMLERPRGELATWLWSGEVRGWASEARLLGGSDRPGYPPVSAASSSQEARYRTLYPHTSGEEARATLAAWEASEIPAQARLRTLEQTLQRLKSALTLWALPSTARQSAREEIIAAWQRLSVREVADGEAIIQLNLDFLDLTDGDLESFPVLEANFDHVNELSLEQNSLTRVPDAFLRHFTQLQRVSLNGCELTSLPTGLGDRLSVLDLANNRLVWDEHLQHALEGYPQLRDLSLANNPLATPPDFARLNRLQGVDLYNCSLATYPAGLDQLDAPNLVDLSGNQLQELPPTAILSPPLARALRLEHNPLSDAALQAADAYYTTHRIDLLVAEIDYNELLDDATPQQRASWQRLQQSLPSGFFRDLRAMFDSPPYIVAPLTYRRRLWRLLTWMDANAPLREQILARTGGTLLDLEQLGEVSQALAIPDLATRSRTLLATIVNHVRLRKLGFGVLSLSFNMSEDSYATLYQWALKRITRLPGLDLAQAARADEPVIIDALVDVMPLPGEAWIEQQRNLLLAVDPTTSRGLDEVLAMNHEEEPVYPAWEHHLRERFAAQFAASRAALDDSLEQAADTLSEGELLVEAQRLRQVYEQRLVDLRRTLTEGVARGTID